MKKISHLFLGIILSTQFAFASGDQRLKQAIDEFHYSMTVEWDQKDLSFAANQEELLLESINTYLSSNPSRAALDAAFFEATKLDLSEVEKELHLKGLSSPMEVKELLKQKIGNNYAKGASWDSGGAAIGAVVAVLLIITLLGAASTVKDCASSTYGNSNC